MNGPPYDEALASLIDRLAKRLAKQVGGGGSGGGSAEKDVEAGGRGRGTGTGRHRVTRRAYRSP